jgi:cytochrome c-type biogenesis protein CcmH/NrfG
MAIDKSNSKPWVKVTVWVLTFGLMFAFMGMGITYLIANWSYLFSSDTVLSQLEAEQQVEYTNEEMIEAYETQIKTYEDRHAEDPSEEDTTMYLAGLSASYAQWIYEQNDTSRFPQAIELLERAIELDAENQEEFARELMDKLKQKVSP